MPYQFSTSLPIPYAGNTVSEGLLQVCNHASKIFTRAIYTIKQIPGDMYILTPMQLAAMLLVQTASFLPCLDHCKSHSTTDLCFYQQLGFTSLTAGAQAQRNSAALPNKSSASLIATFELYMFCSQSSEVNAYHVLKVDNKHVAVRKELLGAVLTQTHCRMEQGGQCQLQAAALHLQAKSSCQGCDPQQKA